MSFDIHVCLVSDQATPNLLPILDPAFRPQEVVMLVSESMKNKAGMLEKALKHRHSQLRVTKIPVADAYDTVWLENRLMEYLAANEDKSVALNATGGTKLMALAAQSVFAVARKPAFYVRPDNNQVLFIGQNQESFVLDCKLKLEDYLAAHGYEVQDKLQRQLNPRYPQLTQTLLTQVGSFETAIGKLNWLANEAEQREKRERKPCLTAQLDGRFDPNFDRLLDMFAEAGVLTVGKNAITFADADARFYAKGGWLEEHVFGVVTGLRGLQDVALNLKVKNTLGDGHTDNELDVAFLAGNRLHIVECKVRNFTDGNTHADDALYKLDSLTSLGGLNTRGLLVSYRKLRDADRQRARGLHVKVIETHQLHDLKNQLQSWISQ